MPTPLAKEEKLAIELRRRLWALYDAAQVIGYDPDNASPEQWKTFYKAIADIPENQYGR